MDKKQKRAEHLGNWLAEREAQDRLDRMAEFAARLSEFEKMLAELRTEAWERQEARHESLQAAQVEILAEAKALRQVVATKEAEREVARRVSDPAAPDIAKKLEELAGELQGLALRRAELSKELAAYTPTGAFQGTLAELKAKMWDPGFYLSRTWLRAMLIGAWYNLGDGDTVSVKFSLEDGLPRGRPGYQPN